MMKEKDICKNIWEVKEAIRKKKKLIYAYGDIELDDKTVNRITKKRILVLGIEREKNENKDN